MKKFITFLTFLSITAFLLTSCSGDVIRETAVTAARGPADTALPHHASLAISNSADERLISAAKGFCDNTVAFSNGSTVFSLILSEDALNDLRLGKADAALLDNTATPFFAPMAEPFRYKNYEHFSMTVNSDQTLRNLSDAIEANIFAGFYTGSNILLSRGGLDSRFNMLSRSKADGMRYSNVHVAAIEASTALAFTLLGADAAETTSLDARISALAADGAIVEFLPSELDSPALLQAIRSNFFEFSDSLASSFEPGANSAELEPFVATQAFTGIKPLWLVFAPEAYEGLSQASRAAVAEAAAYMVSGIDKIYLEYEREKLSALIDEDVTSSRDFNMTRTLALRLVDERVSSPIDQKLREIISSIQ